MSRIEPFVDIHCHILPALDDGPAALDDALKMAEIAAEDGIKTIVATPHQLGNHAGNTGDAIRAAADIFQKNLDRRRIAIRVLPGADVRIEPDLMRKIRTGEVVTLADGGRYVLLELPHAVYFPIDRLLSELRAAGVVGILSHPERNRGILKQPGVLPRLVEQGCLLQVTAGSIMGDFGEQVQKFSASLVQQNLVHFVATDAHGIGSRPPRMGAAFGRVAELSGTESAVELCCRNPGAVVRAEKISSTQKRTAWGGWLSSRITFTKRAG